MYDEEGMRLVKGKRKGDEDREKEGERGKGGCGGLWVALVMGEAHII